MKSRPGSPDYCGHDLSHLFTLRVRVRTDRPTIIIHAFDGNHVDLRTGHTRIDVEVRMGGKTIFPRGATYCAVPSGTTTDGTYAKELVLSLVALKPGDTDADYFADYTPEQLAFAEEYGEGLSCEAQFRYCDENGAVR
jgi:hypothetical protein